MGKQPSDQGYATRVSMCVSCQYQGDLSNFCVWLWEISPILDSEFNIKAFGPYEKSHHQAMAVLTLKG